MKFMRCAARCSLLDHRKNEDILDSVESKLAQYKEKTLNHVSRMRDIGY